MALSLSRQRGDPSNGTIIEGKTYERHFCPTPVISALKYATEAYEDYGLHSILRICHRIMTTFPLTQCTCLYLKVKYVVFTRYEYDLLGKLNSLQCEVIHSFHCHGHETRGLWKFLWTHHISLYLEEDKLLHTSIFMGLMAFLVGMWNLLIRLL